jgi:hypothetical protein
MVRWIPLFLASLCATAVWSAEAHADSAGYSGRESPVGVPSTDPHDGSWGVVPFLAQQGARLAGERVFAGYRFASGVGIEGAQYQTAARDIASTNDALSVAGTVAVPLADKVTATAKAGLHVDQSQVAAVASRPSSILPDKLLGVGVSFRMRENVELALETQHFTGRPTSALGAIPSRTLLLGARVEF